ncbi:ankyrin repeat-containing domain protein [Russula earlei]|uniref:Ankyrin repeat-containing domain protein n=1 Tax=Russula earlei TaxID=71964 RepID=A0ACC0TZY0_9AGAM|nr:ankyrin repeat-containing domain protein [Russula earlei]
MTPDRPPHPDDINAVGGRYGTPLLAAAAIGNVKVAALLLKRLPVDIRSAVMRRTPPHEAAIAGQVEIGKLLLDHGDDVDARGRGDLNPLHVAVLNGHFEFTRLRLSHGANVHVPDVYRETPSKGSGFREIVHLLAEYRAGPAAAPPGFIEGLFQAVS